MRKSSNREKMTPAPTPTFSRQLSASELADELDDLSATGSAPTRPLAVAKPAKNLQNAYSSSPRQPLDQSFLAFRAAGSTSTLLSGSNSSNNSSSSTFCSSNSSNSANNGNGQEDDFVVSTAGPRRTRPHHSHQPARPSATISKERYVFSNFRFLIKQNSRIPAVDDSLDWLDIEMVLVPEIESHLCPICLDLPRFSRFTRCGHVYCLPCILQYFQSSEAPNEKGGNWRACPVCAELMHWKQLRPVHFCPATEAKVGQVLRTVLLEKPVGSLYPALVGSHDQQQQQQQQQQYKNDSMAQLSPFQRLIPVSHRFVLDEILTPELKQARQELKRLLPEASFESTFMEATVNFIEERRREKLTEAHDKPSITSSPNARHSTAKGVYYFHQARDGLNVFLHPLCMNILFHHFSSYPQIPADLSLPVVECERVIVDSWNRKRFKYLDHLPLGTQIILAEVDLSSCVSPETLQLFSRDLASRQQARVQRSLHESSTSRSILQEWRQMEDEYYLGVQASSAIDIVAPPEMVKLDDLDNEASFPLPSSLKNGEGRRPSIPSTGFNPASPPALSFSQLASSLGTPYFHHQLESSTTSTSDLLEVDSVASSPPKSPSFAAAALSPTSPGNHRKDGKKRGTIVLSSTMMHRR